MPEAFPPKMSEIQSRKASKVPKEAPNEPKPLSFATANPWDALVTEVKRDIRKWNKNNGEITQIPVDGQDQPKIYEILDHTLEVHMHTSVLELHAVRVVRTPHGDKRQLQMEVRVMCAWKEVGADILVDTDTEEEKWLDWRRGSRPG